MHYVLRSGGGKIDKRIFSKRCVPSSKTATELYTYQRQTSIDTVGRVGEGRGGCKMLL